MVARDLVTRVLEKASLQSGQHVWAVFEVVAGGELGNYQSVNQIYYLYSLNEVLRGASYE